MNDKFWNWSGWQVFKWITGIVILILVLGLIWDQNTSGEFISKMLNWGK